MSLDLIRDPANLVLIGAGSNTVTRGGDYTFSKSVGAPTYDFDGPPDTATPKLGCVPGDQIVLTSAGPMQGRTFTMRVVNSSNVVVLEQLDVDSTAYEFEIRRRRR